MITIRYFGSLRDTLRRSIDELTLAEPLTVVAVWQLTNPHFPLPENILTAVNMDYVPRTYSVKDGDEVAFFPPVTGG